MSISEHDLSLLQDQYECYVMDCLSQGKAVLGYKDYLVALADGEPV